MYVFIYIRSVVDHVFELFGTAQMISLHLNMYVYYLRIYEIYDICMYSMHVCMYGDKGDQCYIFCMYIVYTVCVWGGWQ